MGARLKAMDQKFREGIPGPGEYNGTLDFSKT
jgi:hypothetical protein